MKGFRTLLFNAAVAIVPILDAVVNNGSALAALTGPQGATIIAVIGAVNMVLRAVTNTPVGHKEA